jgi:FAD/FMN-containing dehydrogenase
MAVHLALHSADPIPADRGVLVNDVHSQLNPTRVARVWRPRTTDQVAALVRQAARAGVPVAIAGARHAMGGQHAADGAELFDTSGLDHVVAFDAERGLVEVQAGIRWPALLMALRGLQRGVARPWTFAQKQTGADGLSLGGAVAANVHGRGLGLRPFVGDVEALTLVDARGDVRACSRTLEPELFALVVGGYGLFGVVTTVTLRLVRRHALERIVEVRTSSGLMGAFARRIDEGCTFGDFQLAIDLTSEGFLREGVFCCYRAVDADPDASPTRRELDEADWRELFYLAHADRSAAFRKYAGHYLATHRQPCWSDDHQMGVYVDDYHAEVDRRLGRLVKGTEVITELYVPRPAFEPFLADVRTCVRERGAEVVYGTVRLIERDDETFLAWARQPWACLVLNLHVDHDTAGKARAAAAFRALIDVALRHGGSYYLTYHRHATRAQADAAHPRLRDFLATKRALDPDVRFQSDWWRHVEVASLS